MMQPRCTWPRQSGMRRCRKSRTTALASVATLSAVTAGVTGCASPQVTTAAPPTVICGTVLSESAAGPVVYDATRKLPTVKHPTIGGLLFFRVARGCERGDNVRWIPSSAAPCQGRSREGWADGGGSPEAAQAPRRVPAHCDTRRQSRCVSYGETRVIGFASPCH